MLLEVIYDKYIYQIIGYFDFFFSILLFIYLNRNLKIFKLLFKQKLWQYKTKIPFLKKKRKFGKTFYFFQTYIPGLVKIYLQKLPDI